MRTVCGDFTPSPSLTFLLINLIPLKSEYGSNFLIFSFAIGFEVDKFDCILMELFSNISDTCYILSE